MALPALPVATPTGSVATQTGVPAQTEDPEATDASPAAADQVAARRLAEAFAPLLLPLLESGAVTDKTSLHAAKQRIRARLGAQDLPTDALLTAALGSDAVTRWPWMRTKPTRSQSGVAIVAVMSSPAACPHGKCTFCPGGPEVDAPQSYTGFEPSTLRARRHGYDAYAIVRERLAQLERNGHEVDKVEIVIQGGTFPAREDAYQDWFVHGIYAALNDGPAEGDHRDPETEGDWMALSAAERGSRLLAAQRANESARCRCVGLTIETKPDWCFEPHVDAMLRLGATRIEIGLQALDDAVLKATHRGHTLADSARALQVARDAGFKVCVHMMPGLPRPHPAPGADGSTGPTDPPASPPNAAIPGALPRAAAPATSATAATDKMTVSARRTRGSLDPIPAADVEDMRRLFSEPAWRPDMLKIYPTLVVQEGETLLKRQWKEGLYTPYDTAAAARVVADGKSFVPEYCRIQRIDRDIPTTHVEAGVLNTNLRQMVEELRSREGLPRCRCIRCREPARRAAGAPAIKAERLMVIRRSYESSGGIDEFLSLEDPEADCIVAFLRLRRVSAKAHRSELRGGPGGGAPDAAFVRELKVYGTATAVGNDDPEAGAWQHRGHGRRLLEAAEAIAFGEWGVGRLLVIAGVGVKAYYRNLGYADLGPYVAKLNLSTSRPSQ